LAHQLVRSLAQDHLREVKRPVPFLFPLHRHRHVRRFEELVLTHLQDRGIHGFTSAAFAFLIKAQRILPVLDGFDELAESGGIRVARETLRGLLGQIHPTSRVLLTSRQAYFRHKGDLSLVGSESLLGDFHTRELEPFDESRRGLFLQKRGLTKQQIGDVENKVKNLAAEELLASPLMLRILADEVKAGGRLQGSTATEVFDFSLRKVCEREVGKMPIPWPPPKQFEFLTTIADLMHSEKTYELEDSDAWFADVVQSDLPAGLTARQRDEAITARVMQLKNHPLLVGFASGGGDAVMFPHPLYRDFFVARDIKTHTGELSKVRDLVQGGLPDAAARFLADLITDDELRVLMERSTDWPQGVKELVQVALQKCDLVSKRDIRTRTQKLLNCIGNRRNFDYIDMSRLRFSLIDFDAFSFVGASFVGSAFQACHLSRCDFNGAQLAGARFYECVADPSTAELLEAGGIPSGAVKKRLFGGERVAIANEDPVVELTKKFFRRFIRDERGKNQRSAIPHAMVAGLGGEERKFTEREIVPLMKSRGVIEDARGTVDVYVFNGAWQTDGDQLIWDDSVSDRLGEIVDQLREKAKRYSLV
jgi:hypothetical protein